MIKIENLIYGKDPKRVSIVDFKLGISTLTSTVADKGWSKIQQRMGRDQKTTRANLGFAIIGYNIYDPTSG